VVHHHFAYGRRIRSAFELPLPRAEAGPADLTIRVSTDTSQLTTTPLEADAPGVLAVLPSPREPEPRYVVTEEPDRFRLRVRGAGEFHISPSLDAATWIVEPGGADHLGPVLVAGTLLALILTLEGNLVLHASAVGWRGRTFAFVGQSGRGKSTTAALCAAAGATVLTDDVLLVEMAGDDARCRGSGGELRLRDKARGLAELFDADTGTAETADARLSLSLAERHSGWAPLTAVVVPFPSRGLEAIEIATVPATEAMFGLLGFPRIEGLRGERESATQFRLHAELVKRVPVVSARVPWGPPWRREVGEELMERVSASVAD
jgi:hypothetical protein